MKTTAKKKNMMEVIINLYDHHSKLFLNALDGISDRDAQNRLETPANHVAWIAGSMVFQRQLLANILGIDVKQTSEHLFKAEKGEGFKSIADDTVYPPLEEYRADWNKITPALRTALVNITDEKLNAPDPFAMSDEKQVFFDTLTYCTDREAYCMGQLGLYRRLLGYDAMKWS